jgi:PII-like signaling protein
MASCVGVSVKLWMSFDRRELAAIFAGGFVGAGIWGYTPDEAPHGDSFWQLRCRLPIRTVIVDTPERIRQWFALVAEVRGDSDPLTSEMVPAFRATGPEVRRGGLGPARL